MLTKLLAIGLFVAVATPIARNINEGILTLRGPLGPTGCTWVEDPDYQVWGFKDCTTDEVRAIRERAAKMMDVPPPPKTFDETLKDLARGRH